MSEEIQEPQVEVTPGEVTYDLYRCPKGHEQRGSGETQARFNADGSITSTGAVCVTCWLTSIGAQFPTSKVEG